MIEGPRDGPVEGDADLLQRTGVHGGCHAHNTKRSGLGTCVDGERGDKSSGAEEGARERIWWAMKVFDKTIRTPLLVTGS